MKLLFSMMVVIATMAGNAYASSARQGECPEPPDPLAPGTPLAAVPLGGLYASQPTYSTSENIVVHASWPEQPNQVVRYRLRRLGENSLNPQAGTLVSTSDPLLTNDVSAWSLKAGSFVDYKNPAAPGGGLTMRGRAAFTIEGWVRPTYLFPSGTPAAEADFQVVAGELSAANFVVSIAITKPTTTTAGDRLNATLKTSNGLGGFSLASINTDSVLSVNQWIYVALTYDGATMSLYTATPGGSVSLVGTRSISGSVANVSPTYFRLGAGSDAPGNLTGCLDGAVDNWGAWNRALSVGELSQIFSSAQPGGVLPTGLNGRLMYSRFESGFQAYPATTTYEVDGLGAFDGTIVNHGTPGISGVDPSKTALRVNHDQIVDARMPVAHTFVAPVGDWPAGIYAVEAVFGDTPAAVSPRNMQCITIRPSSPVTENRIAVVLPVLTWMAYNPWPGVMGEATEYHTASGMSPRRVESGTALHEVHQGNNSVYEMMGDANSPANFSGWRRPNLKASPILLYGEGELAEYPYNAWYAHMDYTPIRWLANHPAYSGKFDILTDLDLHDSSPAVQDLIKSYEALVFVGHPEYWSEPMLDHLHDYLESSVEGNTRNVVNLGGNALTWRAEPRLRQGNDVSLSTNPNWIIEVRKWPTTSLPEERCWFASTTSQAEWSGAWRFLEQLEAPVAGSPRSRYRDLVFGTVNDMVGGFCHVDSTFLTFTEPGQFGKWRIENSNSNLWGASPPAVGTVLSRRIVGNEADGPIPVQVAPTSGLDRPAFIVDGSYLELATGVGFRQCFDPPLIDCRYLKINYDHPVYGEKWPGATRASLSSSFNNGVVAFKSLDDESGGVTYYRHVGNGVTAGNNSGVVLSVASMSTPAGLWLEPRIASLVSNVLACAMEMDGAICP